MIKTEVTKSGVILKAALFLLLAGLTGGPSSASPARRGDLYARVRGLIQHKGEARNFPAAYVRVTIAPKITPDRRSATYTDGDGMYYFTVPMGGYILEVWKTDNKADEKYLIQVDKEKVDIAPIVLP